MLKEINLQALALNEINSPMFQDSIIGLKMNDSNFEAAAQTWSTVEEKTFVHDVVVGAVIDVMDKWADDEEEETVEAVELELSYESVKLDRNIDMSVGERNV